MMDKIKGKPRLEGREPRRIFYGSLATQHENFSYPTADEEMPP
jgi:hypothetical protein